MDDKLENEEQVAKEEGKEKEIEEKDEGSGKEKDTGERVIG